MTCSTAFTVIIFGLIFTILMDVVSAQEKQNTYRTRPEYASNEIIVHLKPGTIQMPAGRYKANRSEITVKQKTALAELMSSQRAEKIKKVFRSFTSADTMCTLMTGKCVNIQDLSQVFVFNFPEKIDVPEMVNRFNDAPSVLHAQPNYLYYVDI